MYSKHVRHVALAYYGKWIDVPVRNKIWVSEVPRQVVQSWTESFFKAVYLKCSDVRCESQVLGLRAGLGIAKFASDRWSGGQVGTYVFTGT